MEYYKISGITVGLDVTNMEFFRTRCEDYALSKNCAYKYNAIGNESIEITLKHTPDINRDEGGNVVSDNSYNISVKHPDRIIHYAHNGTKYVSKIVYYTNYDRVFIEYDSDAATKCFNLDEIDLDYIYVGNAFIMKVSAVGGIMIHSSSIVVNNKAILFSAPSGTGKSTHTNLWKQVYGDKVQFINDDKPVIRFVDNKPIVCGTPFSGKTDINNNIEVPMGAYIYLERGETDSIEKMSVKDSLYCLTEQTIRPNVDKSLYLRNLDSIEKIVNTVPCYRLKCTPTVNAVDVVKKEIFGNED